MLKTFTESKSFFENILDEFSKSDENELLISKDFGSLNLQVARILALLRGFTYINPSKDKLKPVRQLSDHIGPEKRKEIEEKIERIRSAKSKTINNLQIIKPKQNTLIDPRNHHLLYLTEVLFRIDSEHNFRDCDLKNFPSEKIPVQNFGIHYKDLEKGTFVSIDVRSACFIAMSLWQPNIFQKCRTWAEFIDKINGNDCLKNKITRNNHISLLGQKKQNVILNWIMFRIYSALVSELPNAANIFSPENSYDEIIIHFSQNMPENNIEQIKKLVFKVAEKICEERNNNILDPKEIFKVQEFKVMLIKDNKFKFYVKVYPDSFEIKGVPKEKREYYEEYCRKILSKN